MFAGSNEKIRIEFIGTLQTSRFWQFKVRFGFEVGGLEN